MQKTFKNTSLNFTPAFTMKVNVSNLDNGSIQKLIDRVKSDLNLDDKAVSLKDTNKNGELIRIINIQIDFTMDDFKEKQEVMDSIFNNFSVVYGTDKPYITKNCKISLRDEKNDEFESTLVTVFGDKYTKIPKKMNGKLMYNTVVDEFKFVLFVKNSIYQDAAIANEIFGIESDKIQIVTGDTADIDISLFGNVNFLITKIKSVNNIDGALWIATESSCGFITFEQENGKIIKINYNPDSIPLKICQVADFNVIARIMMISWVEKKIVDKNQLFISINEKLTQYLKHELSFTEEDIEDAKKAKEIKRSINPAKKSKKAQKPYKKGGKKRSNDPNNQLHTPLANAFVTEEEEIADEGEEA